MKGPCLCGRVEIALPHRPEQVNICNCRFCRSTGAAWVYNAAGEIAIAGVVADYVREDLEDPWLVAHFCPRCGSMTHCTATASRPLKRIGVNMRLFDLEALVGVHVVYQDGRSVESETDDFRSTGTGQIGDGEAF